MEFLRTAHPSWHPTLEAGLSKVPSAYLDRVLQDPERLPSGHQIFSAFRLPKASVKTILLGESPYPRAESANGYAFWDAAVETLWSERGLSRRLNRATSLRNLIKMLLRADGLLSASACSQEAIAKLDKTFLLKTLPELFRKLLSEGFLLLNAALTLSSQGKNKDALAWREFLDTVLQACQPNDPTLLVWGNIAKTLVSLPSAQAFSRIEAPHPYNLSFIEHPETQAFFRPFQLLRSNR